MWDIHTPTSLQSNRMLSLKKTNKKNKTCSNIVTFSLHFFSLNRVRNSFFSSCENIWNWSVYVSIYFLTRKHDISFQFQLLFNLFTTENLLFCMHVHFESEKQVLVLQTNNFFFFLIISTFIFLKAKYRLSKCPRLNGLNFCRFR